MTTRAVMKARIASDLRRPDSATLATDIENAINDAISAYQGIRLRFTVTDPANPPTFPTVIGQSVYATGDNANIPTLYRIDWVRTLQGSSWSDLTRDDADNLTRDNDAGNVRGSPSWFGYAGNKLVLSPVPDAVYSVRLSGHLRIAAPANDAEANNPWMIDGERLIRARAQYNLAVNVLRNDELAKRMSPQQPSGDGLGHESYYILEELKGDYNRVVSRGVTRPTQF